MRILSIHNSYQIRGGEDESREAEESLLKEMGHQVEVYHEHNHQLRDFHPINLAVNTIWSQHAYQTVRQQLKQNPKDLIHVQNFFPLISPSVYYAAQAEGVPVIQTLRNYRLLCPNGLFFREGQVCEDCLGKFVPWPGIAHGCYRQNRGATGVTAAMLTVHRTLQTWHKQVNLLISLSKFARQKFIEAGWPGEKIVVKPNFIHHDPGVGEGTGGYGLFVGRLSVEKGLDVLLDAWTQLNANVPLKIVGDGPLANLVVEASQKFPHVEWLGRRSLTDVHALMGQAMFLVFPSQWYETFGRVAIEAFAKGTPVIASDIGAIAELVDHGRTGLLFDPKDSTDLTAKIEWLLNHDSERDQMRQAARLEFETKYTAQKNYHQLIKFYDQVLHG